MEGHLHKVLLKARDINEQLEDVNASNAIARRLMGCGLGTPSECTSITHALHKKLLQLMEDFRSLRNRARSKYLKTIRRRFYTVKRQWNASSKQGRAKALYRRLSRSKRELCTEGDPGTR
ncbi:hypothetical protein L7F22_066120 [Adiantum nelumboides]|nr:hypothetical protein [Adiantum nelumboides]